MSGAVKTGAAAPAPRNPDRRRTGPVSVLERAQWRQLAWITLGAVAIFVGLRRLPTGTNLSHQDFRVDPNATNAIEFCDPLNPQFIPVVAAKSPVTMTFSSAQPLAAGQVAACTLTLHTASGKPIAPEDLLVVHTERLHLLIVDPSLRDYQHVHPVPTRTRGEWAFSFTPRFGGTYRFFADFTPAATARGLYANVDADVTGPAAGPPNPPAEAPPAIERDGFRFALALTPQPLRVRQPLDLRFTVVRPDGGPVPMQPVMGAFAHLVAFDETRSGFAHLHPTQTDLLQPPDATHPELSFKLTIPQAGRYVIWAQVNLAGHEVFVPFWIRVTT